MVTGERTQATGPLDSPRRLPPIAQVTVASLILVISGGIYLAAYLPKPAPLGPAVVLVAVSGALLIGNVVALSRLRDFAWNRFFLVGRWALVAYVVVAGMLELVFFLDHVRGGMLVVMTLMLFMFAVSVPLLLAFSVAKYQAVDQPANR